MVRAVLKPVEYLGVKLGNLFGINDLEMGLGNRGRFPGGQA
jgi:hypothetical protein